MLPEWIGYFLFFIIAIGVVLVFFGILNLKDETWFFFQSSTSAKSDVFVSEGIYKYLRHPIYAGIILIMLAYAFYAVSLLKLTMALVMWFVLYNKSVMEERWLIKKFEEFRIYKNSTGRFIPKRNRNR